MTKKTTATIEYVRYYGMPDNAERPVEEGQTLREALKALREAGRSAFGNMGTLTAELSDDTTLEIKLKTTTNPGYARLMNSQYIERGESRWEPEPRTWTLDW